MAYLIHTNFTAGEISPRLDMRVQLQKFGSALAEAQNVVLQPQGGAMKRPGFRFIREVMDSSKQVRLVPFQFSTETAYVLEFGENYLRAFMAGGIIYVLDTDAAISNGTFDSDLSDWTASSVSHSTDNGGQAEFATGGTLDQKPTTSYPEQKHVLAFTIRGTEGTDKLDLKIGSASFGDTDIYSATFGVGYHVVGFTPGTGNTDLYIRFAENGGTAALDDVSFLDDEPLKLTTPFLESELYEIQYTQSADVMYLVHTGHKPRKLSRTGHVSWSLTPISFTNQPSEWNTENYPGSVTFYKQRLCFAGVPSKPQKFWMSVVNSFEDLSTGTSDDDGLAFQLVANEVNAVRWMVPGRSLYIGTSGSEWEIYGEAGQITPTAITADRYTGEGSINHLPVEISGVTLFLHRTGRKLLEFAYTFEQDTYKAPSVIILAEHLTRFYTIRQIAFQNLPHGVVWGPRTDGTLLGFTYLRNQEVMGWHRHVTQGEVEWTVTIKGVMEDELWAVVKRTIGGSTKRYIERLDPEFDGQDIKEAFYVDSGLSYDGAATTTISGLDHLEGEEVQILADGSVHPPKTVSNGEITLDREASRVHAGLGYTTRLKTLDFVGGAPGGTAQSRLHQISRASVRLHETVGGYLGPDDDSLEQLLFRTSADEMGKPIPPFSGNKYVDYWDGYNVKTQILFKHTSPLPATVLGFVAQVQAYDME